MKALVTGASGFIGQYLVKHLIAAGHCVQGLIRKGEPVSSLVNGNVEYIECELGNLNEIELKIWKNPDIFFHLAWVGVSTSVKNDAEIQCMNTVYSVNTINLAKNVGAKRFIGVGSASEYAYENCAITGKSEPSPSDVYAATKVAVHFLCMVMARNLCLHFNWVLFPSIYGPGRVDNNLITYTITKLLRNERPSYTRLEQIWDFIYIEDAVKALLLVGEKGIDGKTYPIGSGRSRKMSLYVSEIFTLAKTDIELIVGELPYKSNRVDNCIMDISMIAEDTGFEPETDFATGIGKTIEFFRQNPGICIK